MTTPHEPTGEWLTDGQLLPLMWRPWYLDRLQQIDGAAWVWPILQAACALPNPADSRFEFDIEPDQLNVLERYVKTADRLIGSTVMNSGATLKIDLVSGVVEKSVPADDATLGFGALLRQMFKHSEEASFDCVRKSLSKAAMVAGATDANLVLSTWKKAHQTLLKKPLRTLIRDVAIDSGLMPAGAESGGRQTSAPEYLTPEKLIEVFLHGDMLHWGKGRELLQEWSASERKAAEMEHEMRNDAYVLAHFYAGFSEIAWCALRRTRTVPN